MALSGSGALRVGKNVGAVYSSLKSLFAFCAVHYTTRKMQDARRQGKRGMGTGEWRTWGPLAHRLSCAICRVK